MVLKNLLRRKGRTLLTILGIGVGMSAIIGLSALADGLEEGYAAVTNGSKADYVLSDAEAYDIMVSTIDERIGEELQAMSEISEISPALQGLVQAEGAAYFFVYSYPPDSFVLERFRLVDGVDIYSHEADQSRGKPVMMGASAAESMNKEVGDMLRIGDGTYRVVGIYETGESFEEGAALLRMEDAQTLLGMSGKVNMYYIKIKDPSLGERLQTRIERLYPDLKLNTTAKLTEKNEQADSMRGMVTGISILAVTIGGLGMMNTQLMAVMERTREIGTLRALGWRRWRIMLMILGESILVGLLGGLLGAALADDHAFRRQTGCIRGIGPNPPDPGAAGIRTRLCTGGSRGDVPCLPRLNVSPGRSAALRRGIDGQTGRAAAVWRTGSAKPVAAQRPHAAHPGRDWCDGWGGHGAGHHRPGRDSGHVRFFWRFGNRGTAGGHRRLFAVAA
jgi:putative ABC transport system permease protein